MVTRCDGQNAVEISVHTDLPAIGFTLQNTLPERNDDSFYSVLGGGRAAEVLGPGLGHRTPNGSQGHETAVIRAGANTWGRFSAVGFGEDKGAVVLTRERGCGPYTGEG